MTNPQNAAWYESLGIGVGEPKPYVTPIEAPVDADYIERAFVDGFDRCAVDDHLKMIEAFDFVTNA